MKTSEQFTIRVILFVMVFAFSGGGLHLFAGVGVEDFFKKVQETADKLIEDVEKKAQEITAEKGSEKARNISKKLLKKLEDAGLPTDPKELIAVAFSKMPKEQLEALATKIIDIILDQFSDLSKIVNMATRPIWEIMRPIPPIPLYGIPIPGLPVAVSAVVDILCDITLSSAIMRFTYDSFAYLKAFHMLTKNKYINDDDKKLIEDEDFDKRKGVIGRRVNLNKLAGASGTFVQEIKRAAGPLVEFMTFLEQQAAPITKPFENMAGLFRPFPLLSFVPIVGPIYNRWVFVFDLKGIKNKFDIQQAVMKNGLTPLSPKTKKMFLGKLTSLTDLEKNPITKPFIKIVRSVSVPPGRVLEKIDEMFVDPFSKLPLGSKNLLIWTALLLNCIGRGIDGLIKEVIETIAACFTGGAALAVTNVLSKVINVHAINEFITEIMYCAHIRYLKRRIKRIDELIEKAQADGMVIDGKALKEEADKIIEFRRDYQIDSGKKFSEEQDEKEEKKAVVVPEISLVAASEGSA